MNGLKVYENIVNKFKNEFPDLQFNEIISENNNSRKTLIYPWYEEVRYGNIISMSQKTDELDDILITLEEYGFNDSMAEFYKEYSDHIWGTILTRTFNEDLSRVTILNGVSIHYINIGGKIKNGQVRI